MPHLHWHECAEMGSTYFDTDGFGVPFPEQNQGPHNFTNNQATVRRAYYGCISYVDSLIGELLQALKDGGAEPHTAVVFTVRSPQPLRLAAASSAHGFRSDRADRETTVGIWASMTYGALFARIFRPCFAEPKG